MGKWQIQLLWKFYIKYDEDIDKGYIFEVDVKYPKELHRLPSGMNSPKKLGSRC